MTSSATVAIAAGSHARSGGGATSSEAAPTSRLAASASNRGTPTSIRTSLRRKLCA